MKTIYSLMAVALFAPAAVLQAETDTLQSFMTDAVLGESLVEQAEVTPVDYQLVSCDDCADDCCGSDCGCGDGCGCGDACGCGGCSLLSKMGGLLKRSDHCFDDFISPMTNPVFFEDPRTLTEARMIFLQHKVPAAALGGDVQLYAVQLRAALTDRLSLIATKDGYAVSTNPLISDGWADLSLGLKYNLLRDPCNGILLSTGVMYELPIGSTRTRQGNGDGEFNLFATGGARLSCNSHWISAVGFRLPTNQFQESTSMYWSNHFDYKLSRSLYALMEFNWYHWMDSGQGGVPGVEGLDLFNLGSTGVAGNDIVTGAFGVKCKPSCNSEIGLAWEVPLTDRKDVLENRLTLDWIVRY